MNLDSWLHVFQADCESISSLVSNRVMEARIIFVPSRGLDVLSQKEKVYNYSTNNEESEV